MDDEDEDEHEEGKEDEYKGNDEQVRLDMYEQERIATLLAESGKLLEAARLIYRHLTTRPDNEGVLVFCDWTTGLHVLRRVLMVLLYPLVRKPPALFHGKLTTRERAAIVDDFQVLLDPRQATPRWMLRKQHRRILLSTSAGSESITLTAATLVLNLNPTFAPMAGPQKANRADRIGQRRNVTAIDLINADDETGATTDSWLANSSQLKMERAGALLPSAVAPFAAHVAHLAGLKANEKANASFTFKQIRKFLASRKPPAAAATTEAALTKAKTAAPPAPKKKRAIAADIVPSSTGVNLGVALKPLKRASSSPSSTSSSSLSTAAAPPARPTTRKRKRADESSSSVAAPKKKPKLQLSVASSTSSSQQRKKTLENDSSSNKPKTSRARISERLSAMEQQVA